MAKRNISGYSTQALIDAALAAKTAFDTAKASMQQATSTLQQAQATLVQAEQDLHDDLAANGPYATVDETTTPPVVTVYSAVDPDTYQATVIRTG